MENEGKKLSSIAQREEEILSFWREKKIFEKTLEQTEHGEAFSFYDGPPFATGVPHYGHIVTSAIKDAIPRYQTMCGRHVRRVWGWDCHGLPIENLIEGELGLPHKKDIEEYGIGKFNEAARASVLRYDSLWKEMIPRIGRWIDMEHSYKTMDASYTESVWWAFKTLYEKGLIYQGFKAMQICPRCETTLSNNEVADGYKDITDISVTVKFELEESNTKNLTPKTYVLAWTTTPWTLPGNVALAVNSDEEYIKVSIGTEKYILAKERAEKILAGKEYEIISRVKGKDLVGKKYKPIFDYYSKDESLANHKNGWKIYGADFVTMDSGTGVVHIAPAFGEDDMALGKKENLPFIQHISMDGIMKKEVRDFAGVSAKPKTKEKDGHQSTDILIIKHLAGVGALFSKEKIIHAYPHCWRCDTPLLNYATESWFVKVTDLKGRLVEENAKTKWVPENLRDGRFGQWLLGARDWAISRSRFWGAPLPVWNCDSCEKRSVFGSRAELAQATRKSGNKYFVMRHGEAESNRERIVSSTIATGNSHGLTEKGRKEVKEASQRLDRESIQIIISSPFLRARQTAESVADTLGLNSKEIIIDERLKEIDTGVFDGKSIDDYRGYFASMREKFIKRPEKGENLLDVKRRVMELMDELEEKYQGKNILLVTHEYPLWMITSGVEGADVDRALGIKEGNDDFIKTGEIKEIPFTLFPHNAEYEFDMHRPYIDNVPVVCSCGGKMLRVPYVFDCWFESGSMPYAQFHYPFENKELFEKNFPANFIAEGIDQTRGWFYNMLNLSVGLFGKAPFKNVLVNGLVLAEDGQKMSKRLKNYPDPLDIINRYGADAMRYYLLSSPLVHAEDFAFSEKGVDEVVKKVLMRLLNVLSFYELHKSKKGESKNTKENILDQWILSRLAELGNEMTLSLDKYELERAIKPIGLFVDDLSTWYLRRSRDRFKSDDEEERTQAIETTREVFFEFSKLIAPIMPFMADHIYLKMEGEKESVHLEEWPVFSEPNQDALAWMKQIRQIVSLALEARAKAEIKVRQPLHELKVKSGKLKVGYAELIKDEVNVKEVVFDDAMSEEVELDTIITPELKQEGQFRELARAVQELRKTKGLTPSDMATLEIGADEEGRALVDAFSDELKKTSLLNEIVFKEVQGESVDANGILFTIALSRK
ncbi:MAG: class I tRNA ligase family protein [Candidatus Yonathbacteria bacterium]|nr:class I tRNA ligase family protein [Candidatus Yonathbacteria bacterium]